MSKFIEQLKKALEAEKLAEISFFNEQIRNQTIQERQEKGVTFYPVIFVSAEIGSGNTTMLTFKSADFDSPHCALQNGQVVSVFTQVPRPKNVESSFQGVVYKIYKDTLKIIPYNEDFPDWVEDGKIGIDLYFDEKTYQLMEKALESLQEKGSISLEKLKKICFEKELPTFQPEYPIQIPGLNLSQNQAIVKIFTANELAIVHGPPGTGKTTTIVEAIRLLAKQESKILVCAASNTATDLLARRLFQKKLKVVRLGNPARINQDLWNLTLDAQAENHLLFPEIQKLRKRAEQEKHKALKWKRSFSRADREARNEALKEAKSLMKEAEAIENEIFQQIFEDVQIVCATLTGSVSHWIDKIPFSTVVIDEAGQALEPACWIAIPKGKKLLIAGDHYQLPPTVKSVEAEKMGLSKTLFERLIHWFPNASVMLDVQYRANEKIMKFSSDYFYNGNLNADETVKSQLLPQETHAITFIDTAGCGFTEVLNEETSSYSNPEEAGILIDVLRNLRKQTPNLEIGVISPYKEQVRFLGKLFSEIPELQGVQCDTVDGFQGEEKDVIAISLVRSNDKGEIGFLKDIRRMNVAITRARKKMIAIGDSATLGNDKFYSSLLDFWNENAEYRTAWEWL